VQGDAKWGLWSVHHTLSLPLLPPQGRTHHTTPAPAWGSSHGRQSSMNCSSISPCHEVQSLRDCSSMGPPWGHKPAPPWAPLSTGPARSLLQHGLPMVSQPRLGILLLWHGVVPGLQVGICSTVDLHGLWGTACLTMVFSTGCREISALVPGAPPPPPSALTLVSAELFLSHILTHLSCWKLPRFFFPLLNYVIPKVLPPLLMGSALPSDRSLLEPAGTGSIGHRGSFQQLLTEATPVAPLLPKPCHAKG